jgi:hypothetical protein
MDENFNYFFPRYIDRPRLIGIFEFDEFVISFLVMTSIIALSLATPQISSLEIMLIAIGSGAGVGGLYKKFKKNMPDGYLVQKLYRMGVYSPGDDKKAVIKYPYLKKIKRIVPYGFTKVLIN